MGLKPVDIKHNNTDGSIHNTGKVTFGAYGDSYYEYLLKQYIFTGKTDAALLDAYKAAMHGVRLWLLGETAPESLGGLMYLGQADLQSLSSNATYTKGLPLKTSMEHLVCFVPGLLALGHIHGIETGVQPCGLINTCACMSSACEIHSHCSRSASVVQPIGRSTSMAACVRLHVVHLLSRSVVAGQGAFEQSLPDLVLAERLMQACYAMYSLVPTGLAPDTIEFRWRSPGIQAAQRVRSYSISQRWHRHAVLGTYVDRHWRSDTLSMRPFTA